MKFEANRQNLVEQTVALRSILPFYQHLIMQRLSTAFRSLSLTQPIKQTVHQTAVRSFADKPLPVLANLDTVNLTWERPAILKEHGYLDKREVRAAAHQKALSKAARGARRRAARVQKVESAIKAAQTDDWRGLNPDVLNQFDAVIPALGTNVTESEIDAVKSLGSYHTASSSELLHGRIRVYREKYGKTPSDCGSSEVQIAIMSDRIKTLQAHTQIRTSDTGARKRLYVVRSRRRKLLKYLRRHNFHSFEMMMRDFRIAPAEVDGEGWTENSGNQQRRPARSG